MILKKSEEFRVSVVDSAVIPLFLTKKIGQRADFEKIEKRGQYQLSAEGKAKVVAAVFNHLNQMIRWRGRRRLLKNIISEQSRLLARYFLGKEDKYVPFDHRLLS